MADGATFDLAGFAGRTGQKTNEFTAARQSSSCSAVQQAIPGGVTSCSVVLSVSSFSTTISANSSSKDVLREDGTFHKTVLIFTSVLLLKCGFLWPVCRCVTPYQQRAEDLPERLCVQAVAGLRLGHLGQVGEEVLQGEPVMQGYRGGVLNNQAHLSVSVLAFTQRAIWKRHSEGSAQSPLLKSKSQRPLCREEQAGAFLAYFSDIILSWQSAFSQCRHATDLDQLHIKLLAWLSPKFQFLKDWKVPFSPASIRWTLCSSLYIHLFFCKLIQVWKHIYAKKASIRSKFLVLLYFAITSLILMTVLKKAVWTHLLPDSGPAASDWLQLEAGGRYRQEWGVTGDPLGTAGHTRTGTPHLSEQGRSLQPRNTNKNSKRDQNTFLKAAQPIRILQPVPNSPEHRLYPGTSGPGESVALYKALDSRPGRDNSSVCGKNTVTLLDQLIINDRRAESVWHMTVLSLQGCERTIPQILIWLVLD